MITIAIATYQRLDSLRTLISQIKTHTRGEYNLIVSVDGSTDGTVEYLTENRINHIYSENRGVCHAKNLLMWWFFNQTKDDILIMLEDDCRIWEDNWCEHWVYIANYYKYVNFYEGQQTSETRLFNISPAPMMVRRFGAAVMAMHRDVITKVGYMDPELDGYGFEHVEYTCRIYETFKDIWQGEENAVPGYNQHIGVEYKDSNFNDAVFIRNWRKAIDLLQSGKALYRLPFKDGLDLANGDKDDWEYAGNFKRCANAAKVYVDPVPDRCVGQVCPLCGCLGKHIGYKGQYPIRECCGMLLSFPYKTRGDYERIYVQDGLYHNLEQRREGQLPFWERDDSFIDAAKHRLGLINAWLPLQRCRQGAIDIGAGTGAFVEIASVMGVPTIGVEPNQDMVDFAQRFRRDVRLGSWKTLAAAVIPDQCAMLVTAFDVFEHLTDPLGFLEAMKRPLLPGGILVIETPEIACAQQLKEGLEWKHIRPRQHVCMYSDQAAQKVFAKAGWKVEASFRPKRGSLGKISYFISRA